MSGVAFVDGRVVPLLDARVPITDRGFLYGDGVFTSVRLEGGRAKWWPLHLERLARDASALAIVPPDEAMLTAAMREVGAVLPELASARLSITRVGEGAGPGSRGGEPGRLVILARPLGAAPATLRVRTTAVRRSAADLHHHKLVNYLDHVLALQGAAVAGADETLYIDDEWGALELATGALFVCTAEGEWVVPPAAAPILDSVTRRALLDARFVARKLNRDELGRALEIVHGNAVRGVRAVSHLDGRALTTGPLLHELTTRFASTP